MNILKVEGDFEFNQNFTYINIDKDVKKIETKRHVNTCGQSMKEPKFT